jgi:hypothetical protein
MAKGKNQHVVPHGGDSFFSHEYDGALEVLDYVLVSEQFYDQSRHRVWCWTRRGCAPRASGLRKCSDDGPDVSPINDPDPLRFEHAGAW